MYLASSTRHRGWLVLAFLILVLVLLLLLLLRLLETTGACAVVVIELLFSL